MTRTRTRTRSKRVTIQRPGARNQKSDQNPNECLPVLGIEFRIEYRPQPTRATLGPEYMIHLPLRQSKLVVVRWTIGVTVFLRISVATSVFTAASLVSISDWAAVANACWSHPAGAECEIVFVGGARDQLPAHKIAVNYTSRVSVAVNGPTYSAKWLSIFPYPGSRFRKLKNADPSLVRMNSNFHVLQLPFRMVVSESHLFDGAGLAALTRSTPKNTLASWLKRRQWWRWR